MKQRIRAKTVARAHLSLPYDTWEGVKKYCKDNNMNYNKFVDEAIRQELYRLQGVEVNNEGSIS